MTSTFAARHSMDSPEWYTPSPIVEAAREVMGAIDLDPASHTEANLTVRAFAFFTEEQNGLLQHWYGRVFLNPPGGEGRVPKFWRKLVASYYDVDVDARVQEAIWIGYSLEQLQSLQRAHEKTPLHFSMCVPRKRVEFIENEAKQIARLAKVDAENEIRKAKGEKLKRRNENADAPSHANYISYLGPNTDIFARVFDQFGQVVTR